MLRAESTHVTLDGVEYDVVLHVYGEQDWRGFLIKPGSQVWIPERGTSKEEVLAKLITASRPGLISEVFDIRPRQEQTQPPPRKHHGIPVMASQKKSSHVERTLPQ